MKGKVIVGMSGGVDSSVCAYLLKKEGYQVIGVTLNLWDSKDPQEGICGGASAIEDAGRVADRLGIDFQVIEAQKEFRQNVVDYFTGEYLAGRTPNPCNVCNRFVKWEALYRIAEKTGADHIATGHYARIDRLPNGRFAIRNSITAKKDQTYALYDLTQDQLSRTLLPIGQYEKAQIRELATEADLPVADKKDSQDICFIPDGDYGKFLNRIRPDAIPGQGNFLDTAGNVIGRHQGYLHYTIGQRKGLGMGFGQRIFVQEIRPETNEVILGSNESLFTDCLTADHLNYMAVGDFVPGDRFLAKIRYADSGTYALVKEKNADFLTLEFEKPVRAVTPGQALVLYQGEYVAGGGLIRN